jgi:hypothetical protein
MHPVRESPQTDDSTQELDALIEEARRRARMRRLDYLAAAVAIGLLAFGGIQFFGAGGGGTNPGHVAPGGPSSAPSPPYPPHWQAEAASQLQKVRTCLREEGYPPVQGQQGMAGPPGRGIGGIEHAAEPAVQLRLGTPIGSYWMAVAPTLGVARHWIKATFQFTGASQALLRRRGRVVFGSLSYRPLSTTSPYGVEVQRVANCANRYLPVHGTTLLPAQIQPGG